MPARATHLAITALLLGACTLDFDVVGPHGGGTEGGNAPSAGGPPGGGSSDGGGTPICNGSCIDLGTFVGPFSIDEAGCQEPVLGGFADSQPAFSAPLAMCTCACELPTQLGCPPVFLSFHDEISCENEGFNLAVEEGVCLNPETVGVSAYSFDRPKAGGAATFGCESTGTEPNKPPVQFTVPFTACPLDESSCGDSRVCLPQDLTGLCVISSGDVACPDELPVARKVLRADELFDDRDCDCTCGLLTATCTPAFELYKDGSCSSIDAAQSTVSCIGALDNTQIEGLVYRPVATGAECAAPTEAHDGGVTEGPINTLCCAE